MTLAVAKYLGSSSFNSVILNQNQEKRYSPLNVTCKRHNTNF